MRIEVSLGLWQDRPPEEVIETALIADALGFPAVWIGEMATWDAFALGSHIGAQLTYADLVLGPFAVAVRDPVTIAMGVASVAALTHRGVSVALGTSSPVVVEKWHGRDRRDSGSALAESAQAVRALLDGKKADLAGRILRTSGYRLRLPAPRSELVIAAFGPRAIEAAARYADRMVLNLVDPSSVAFLVGQLRAAAVRLQRPAPRVAVWVTAAADPGPMATDQLRHSVVGYLAAPGYSEMFARAGFVELVAYARTGPHPRELFERVPAELAAVVGLLGDRQQIEDRIRQYAAAGADDIVVVPSATEDDPAAKETLRACAEVAERLR